VNQERRDIHWTPWDEPGSEHLCLTLAADGVHADGVILRRKDDRDLRVHYRVETDPAWQVRRLHLAILGSEHALHLERDDAGNWEVNRSAAPELAGCHDIDIEITPFTNTLPIRRLALAEGESAEIRVAYVPVPELAVRPAEQRYTCLAPRSPAGGLYRYEGLFRGFTAELPVDPDGLVRDYPETFRRTWPR
jgi:hypothetical protein